MELEIGAQLVPAATPHISSEPPDVRISRITPTAGPPWLEILEVAHGLMEAQHWIETWQHWHHYWRGRDATNRAICWQ